MDPGHQWRFTRIPLLGAGESYTMDDKAAVPGKPPLGGALRRRGLAFFHYPNSWNHFPGRSFDRLPAAADRRPRPRSRPWLVHKGRGRGRRLRPAEADRGLARDQRRGPPVVEENQKGINSPAFVPGPYSTIREDGVIQFVDWYLP